MIISLDPAACTQYVLCDDYSAFFLAGPNNLGFFISRLEVF